MRSLRPRCSRPAPTAGPPAKAIRQTVNRVDVILGPIGIVIAHAMMGEVTPAMAEAVSASAAPKLLLPLSQDNIAVVGGSGLPLPKLVDELIDTHLRRWVAA